MKNLRQIIVDLKEIQYQCGDCKDRQGEYISDNILDVVKQLEKVLLDNSK